MMDAYFQNLAEGLAGRIAGTPAGEPIARKVFALETAKLGTRLYGGDSMAWCGVLVPFDLLNAMGVTSCFVEFVGAMLAGSGTVEPLLERAEQTGYSNDGCGYHRAVTGAMLQDMMPKPDFLIATTAPCSGGFAVIENLARHFKKDLFVIQVPPDNKEHSVQRLAEQLKQMVQFVSDHTGRPIEQDALSEAIAKSNRIRELLLETYEYVRAVPSPARGRDFVNFGVVLSLFYGTDAGIRIAETYRDEMKAGAQQQKAGIPGEEIRLLWLQNRIQFKQSLERQLATEHKAAIIDELNDITFDAIDPDDPYTGMAERLLSLTLCSSAERRVARLQHLAKSYRVHGAINPTHWGCRQGSGTRGLMASGLRAIGIPMLNLEVDCIDPRSFAPGQLKTRVEAFIEMLRS